MEQKNNNRMSPLFFIIIIGLLTPSYSHADELLDLLPTDDNITQGRISEESIDNLLDLDSLDMSSSENLSPDQEYIPSDMDVIDTMKIPKKKGRSVPPTHDDIVNCVKLLTSVINIRPLLRESLYLRTHPLMTRNVLDLPVFSLYNLNRENISLKLDIFYNQASELKFTKDDTDISAYIALQEQNTLSALQNLEQQIRDFLGNQTFDIHIPPLLQFVSRMHVTERKAGLMISAIMPYEKLLFEIKTPLLYQQRNFDLGDAEIDAINRLRIPGVYIPKNGGISDFTRRYFIADRIGMGDLRFTLTWKIVDFPDVQYFAGLEITAPTHFAFKRGLIGGRYEKGTCMPNFDICTLIQLGKEDFDTANNYGTNFLLGVLHQLSSNVLDERDHRPIGIGLIIKSEWDFTHWVKLRTRTIFEYLTPYFARRYFITEREHYYSNRDFEDSSQAEKNLDLLNTQLIEKLYPFVVETWIRPGFQIKNTTSINITHGNWTLAIGSDTWWKQEEKFDTLCSESRITKKLNKEIGQLGEVFQNKIFGGATYKKEIKGHDLLITLAADGSTVSEYVGHDFTVMLGFEIDF